MSPEQKEIRFEDLIDQKLDKLYKQKLDKWLYIPTIALFLVLLGIVFNEVRGKAEKTTVQPLKAKCEDIDKMELRLVQQINKNHLDLLEKLDQKLARKPLNEN